MSGVYISGVEMPKSCYDCPVECEGDICGITKGGCTWDERPPHCPLVPVPDHGDLIDRDKLVRDIEKYIGGEESRSRFHHWVQVQNAVISRDKETEV